MVKLYNYKIAVRISSSAAAHDAEILHILSKIEYWSCILLCSQFQSWVLYMLCHVILAMH